jgi:hypothetical protein
MTEEHEELASRGYVYCFDCGDTFMDVPICQNL